MFRLNVRHLSETDKSNKAHDVSPSRTFRKYFPLLSWPSKSNANSFRHTVDSLSNKIQCHSTTRKPDLEMVLSDLSFRGVQWLSSGVPFNLVFFSQNPVGVHASHALTPSDPHCFHILVVRGGLTMLMNVRHLPFVFPAKAAGLYYQHDLCPSAPQRKHMQYWSPRVTLIWLTWLITANAPRRV